MRILVADPLPPAHVERLRALGHDVTYDPGLDAESLPRSISGHDVLVVRSTRVTGAAIERADTLALIVRAGAGVNTIDVAAAAERAVVVTNTPGRNAVAVAELALGLILAIDRNIPDNVAALREGKWEKNRWSQAPGLAGRSLGIVGFGAIGREVARRAAAFEMQIVLLERPGRSADAAALIEELGCVVVPDLAALAEASDVISFHVPAAETTKRLVDAAFLHHVRPGAVIINTSRADVIDEAALLAAVDAKGLRVGVDVFADEPEGGTGSISSSLAAHPSVYGAPTTLERRPSRHRPRSRTRWSPSSERSGEASCATQSTSRPSRWGRR